MSYPSIIKNKEMLLLIVVQPALFPELLSVSFSMYFPLQ